MSAALLSLDDRVAVAGQRLLHLAEAVAAAAKRHRPDGEVAGHVLLRQALDGDGSIGEPEPLQPLADRQSGERKAGAHKGRGQQTGQRWGHRGLRQGRVIPGMVSGLGWPP